MWRLLQFLILLFSKSGVTTPETDMTQLGQLRDREASREIFDMPVRKMIKTSACIRQEGEILQYKCKNLLRNLMEF